MLQPHPIHDVLSHPAAIAQTELAGIMVFGRGLTAVLWEGLPTATAGAKIRQVKTWQCMMPIPASSVDTSVRLTKPVHTGLTL
mmetsp:Transcript_28859/g.59600  ORF Transcript_28859/g.59600 Transcript_28859/m.59600 type:complete len:83 (-) Transcript_28859:147-395(-)